MTLGERRRQDHVNHRFSTHTSKTNKTRPDTLDTGGNRGNIETKEQFLMTISQFALDDDLFGLLF